MGKNKNRNRMNGQQSQASVELGDGAVGGSPPAVPKQETPAESVEDASEHTSDNEWEMDMPEGPAGTLCKDYELRVRPMIDLIDKLRRIGLDQEVGLPSIVVVGDQSAGKSSVLEAISGVQLPRGSGIVTRCPLELRLKRSSEAGYWSGRIHYKSEAGPVEEGLDSPEEVGMRVREAQDALAGEGKGISTDLITLEIEAQGLPDLTLIDLPGIVRVSMKGQPDNMAHKIRTMIRNYIKKDETIILTVVPANVDIETSEALNMAAEVDPEHIRTLGVITKADMVDKGAEDDLVAVLNNESYHLKKGYIAVKCRGQQAIKDGQSLQQALQEEDDFFAAAEHFGGVARHLYGIRSLSTRLTDELVEQVQRVLPDLRDQVFRKRADTREKLNNLGDGIPTSKVDKSRYLMKLLSDYASDLNNLAEGREDLFQSKVRLHNSARSAFAEFSHTIRRNVQHKEGSGSYRNEVRDAMVSDRGRELPRFIKYETFRTLASTLVREFDPPSRTCLKEVADTIHIRLGQLATSRFKRFPLLMNKVKGLIAAVMEAALDRGDKALSDLFGMERLIFSQDEHFNDQLDDIIKKKVEEMAEQPTTYQTIKKKCIGFLELGESQDKEVDSMFTVIQAYMRIAVNRISDNVPMVILQHVIIKVAEELQTRVLYLTEEDAGGLDALKEEKNIEFKRNQLVASLNRLEEASRELNGFNP